MSQMTYTLEPEVAAPVQEMPVRKQAPALQLEHPLPTEEQITRVLFMIIMAASVLFIAATLFLTRM